MSKEVNTMVKKKLNIAELIANAENIKKKKEETKEFYVKSLDGTVTIMKPNAELMSDCFDMEDSHESDLYLIYESCIEPNLKDPQLHTAYGTVGYEILDKIFDPGEIAGLSTSVVEFAGYKNSIEEIKN